MKCEKCGKEINKVLINQFLHDGSDCTDSVFLEESENCSSVYFETHKFPFKHKEVQVYDVVRVVCFKSEVADSE